MTLKDGAADPERPSNACSWICIICESHLLFTRGRPQLDLSIINMTDVLTEIDVLTEYTCYSHDIVQLGIHKGGCVAFWPWLQDYKETESRSPVNICHLSLVQVIYVLEKHFCDIFICQRSVCAVNPLWIQGLSLTDPHSSKSKYPDLDLNESGSETDCSQKTGI